MKVGLRFKGLTFDQGRPKASVTSMLSYSITALHCKRKIKKTRELCSLPRNEARATLGLGKINAFQDQGQFSRLDLDPRTLGMLKLG